MGNNIILQVGGLLILLVVVLTLAFYLIYPLISENRSKRCSSEQEKDIDYLDDDIGEDDVVDEDDLEDEETSISLSDDDLSQSTSGEQKISETPTSPIVDYGMKANAILNENKRVERIVEKENEDMMGKHPLPDYQDDPSSIDLFELNALRKDIRRMTRELSLVKRSNADLQKMIMELQKDHEDALSRVANTDLWAAEKQRWASDFEKAYRSYEEQKAKLPPPDKKDSKSGATNKQ